MRHVVPTITLADLYLPEGVQTVLGPTVSSYRRVGGHSLSNRVIFRSTSTGQTLTGQTVSLNGRVVSRNRL